MEDLTRRIAQIRDDREHGSRWLARQTILLLQELATEPVSTPEEQMQKLRQAGRDLAHARPAMASLAGAVGRVLSASGGLEGMGRAAQQLLQEYDAAIPSITAHSRSYLRGTIMTHSLSGTVLEVLKACIPSVEEFIVLEGRPLYEGRTTAGDLAAQSARVMLITDAQAEIFLPGCQAVVVGADSVLADGSVLNKAGTALLARAAFAHSVPFYVLTETLKISSRVWNGDLHLLEEHPASEVWEQATPGIRVRNFYFDRTPAELVTQVITEQGGLNRAEIRRQAALLRQVSELT